MRLGLTDTLMKRQRGRGTDNMKLNLLKTISGLVPVDPDSEARYNKIKIGAVIEAETKEVRNPKFHRQYFALLNVGFDNWSPGEIDSKYGTPAKNFERFRKDIAILCGYYDIVIRLDGSTRPEAQSISFAGMSQETFEDLYSKTIDVFLNKIYGEGSSAEEIDRIVSEYLRFC